MPRQILDSETRRTRSRVATVIEQRFERLEADKEYSGAVAVAACTRPGAKDSGMSTVLDTSTTGAIVYAYKYDAFNDVRLYNVWGK